MVSSDLLGRVLRAVTGHLDGPAVLTATAAVLVDAGGPADWCVVDLLAPPDLVTRVVALDRDGPLPVPMILGGQNARRSSSRQSGLLGALAEAPGQRLRLDTDALAQLAASEDPRTASQAGLARSLGTVDLLLLGLASRDELLGVLAVGAVGGRFGEEAVAGLVDVATLVGAALDGVRVRSLQRGVSAALQTSLLPALPAVRGLTLAARFVTADLVLAVGGDWYDAFALPAGGLALVVGDTTGHDVQAATRMAELRTLLRGLAVDRQDGPAATLSRLDRVAHHLSPELSGTCVYARLDLPQPDVGEELPGPRLRWSSAGHLPPVLLRAGRAELLATTPDLMLGVRQGLPRADHERDLEPGDVLLLYTDGLVEDRLSGLDARLQVLSRTVEALGPDDVEALVDGLVAALPSGEDDVAVLAVRVERPA